MLRRLKRRWLDVAWAITLGALVLAASGCGGINANLFPGRPRGVDSATVEDRACHGGDLAVLDYLATLDVVAAARAEWITRGHAYVAKHPDQCCPQPSVCAVKTRVEEPAVVPPDGGVQ